VGVGGEEDEAVVAARVFRDTKLRDTMAPLLVPCYNLTTAALFLFSHTAAAEWGSLDFRL
jgi:hypothetical protein